MLAERNVSGTQLTTLSELNRLQGTLCIMLYVNSVFVSIYIPIYVNKCIKKYSLIYITNLTNKALFFFLRRATFDRKI